MSRPDYRIVKSVGEDGKKVVSTKSYDIDKLVAESKSKKVWRKHVVDDLLKFWMKEATELENGLFPTWISDEGKIVPVDEEKWPKEYKLAKADHGMSGLIVPRYNFMRAHSRLTYAYGIAYHMTGNVDYLELCKKGAEAIMNAADRNHGLYTRQDRINGKWLERREERNSQDLAYGITGLGMYYFLTHDERTLHAILQAKDYIFRTYYDEGLELFSWYPNKNDKEDIEIVAQLDQVYAYMLFLTPALPEPYQSEWKEELKGIAEVLVTRFYSERYKFFWGTDNKEDGYDSKRLGSDHTDFGHSVKTMWLIYKIGMLVHEPAYVIFAREKIDKILEDAYNPVTKSWNRRFDANGKIDQDKEWWILAELDQACEILAIHDPSYLEYLNNTTDYWFSTMVDHENGEIWHMVDGITGVPKHNFPKAHCWKTSLHSFEHALFGYMTSAQIKGEEFKLFYAFDSKEEVEKTAVPYMFRAKMVRINEDAEVVDNMPGLQSYCVTYKGLH